MILLWGVVGDGPMDAVHAALLRRGAPTVLVNQRRLQDVSLELEVGARVSGVLRAGQRCIEVEDISGIYLRPHDRAQLPPSTTQRLQGWTASREAALDDGLQVLAQLAGVLVLNRPDAMAANNSKPYQSTQIRSVGFSVPDTLITTDPRAASEFLAHHGRVVYKSISGTRSIVGELGPSDVARLEEVTWCPTQLQQRVEGIDVRVHVVGDSLFACEVRSRAVDYRYAALSGETVSLAPYDLPGDCAERCLALSRAAKLPLAGIDLRRTQAGEWYCFEANPSPAFMYYQQATGHPIDDTIAELLELTGEPADHVGSVQTCASLQGNAIP